MMAMDTYENLRNLRDDLINQNESFKQETEDLLNNECSNVSARCGNKVRPVVARNTGRGKPAIAVRCQFQQGR